MPDGIVIAAIVGVITIIWLIQRSRAEPRAEFRQDTMRYITLDSDRKTRNQQPMVEPSTEGQSGSGQIEVETVPEMVVAEDREPDFDVSPKPVLAGEDPDDRGFEDPATADASDDAFASPELLFDVNDK